VSELQEVKVTPIDLPQVVRRLLRARGGVAVTSPNTLPLLVDAAGYERALEALIEAAGEPVEVRVALTPVGHARVDITVCPTLPPMVTEVAEAHGGDAGVDASNVAWIEVPTLRPRTP
jgi:hypothetical protein